RGVLYRIGCAFALASSAPSVPGHLRYFGHIFIGQWSVCLYSDGLGFYGHDTVADTVKRGAISGDSVKDFAVLYSWVSYCNGGIWAAVRGFVMRLCCMMVRLAIMTAGHDVQLVSSIMSLFWWHLS